MTAKRGVRRTDLGARDIALRWISGMSQLDISTELDCTQGTVSSRLSEARRDFPDLPWEERQVRAEGGGSNVAGYLAMNDGKPGESRLTAGSVVRSSTMRRR